MEVVTPKGILKCRKPNVLEIYDYLEAVGSLQETNAIKLRALMIKAIAPYLVTDAFSEPMTFDQMIEDAESFYGPLTKLSDELYTSVIGVLSKKA